ncbi:MAG: hypothetical protein KAR17_14690, partial [Cyclobacteriaceae bacterium]|nr:hypothetical protein [Cyclobacteriaceae bacterium]
KSIRYTSTQFAAIKWFLPLKIPRGLSRGGSLILPKYPFKSHIFLADIGFICIKAYGINLSIRLGVCRIIHSVNIQGFLMSYQTEISLSLNNMCLEAG